MIKFLYTYVYVFEEWKPTNDGDGSQSKEYKCTLNEFPAFINVKDIKCITHLENYGKDFYNINMGEYHNIIIDTVQLEEMERSNALVSMGLRGKSGNNE